MAAVLLFWNTNMAAVTSCENALVDEISWCVQMKATEQYFPVVLFIMLYKVVLTFESVDEIY